MDDIIKYHLIPLIPVKFLDVCEWTRKVALGRLHLENVSCDSSIYYRVVRLLGDNGMYDNLYIFVMCNYYNAYFCRCMWSLVREGHKQIIYGFFKYIYYHPYEVACNMINLFKAWMKQDDIENIREYINDVQYAELVNYYDVGSRQWLSPEHHGLIWRNRISSSVES